ncbi:MAG: MotA/TolQ/ExbB proton channel family protein [Deltaproteobacteria bacterium]
MIIQTICSFLVLIGIFVLSFCLEVRELGLASNLNAVVIVFGGTLFATLLAYPLSKLTMTAKFLKRSFNGNQHIHWTIQTLVRLARISKKGGVLALEREGDKLPKGLIRTGVGLMAYNFSRENVEQILHKEALLTVNQYETAYKILCSMAKLAPAMGLAGTVVNLIRTFGHLSSPQNLIGYMAIALLSTFYGVVLANICFVPLSNKLREFMDQDLLRMDMIKEGILDIYDGEHPRALQYKLETLAGIPSAPYAPNISLVETPLQTSQGNG